MSIYTTVVEASSELVQELLASSISPLEGPASALSYLSLSDDFDSPRFADVYAGRNLLRKYGRLPTGINLQQVAYSTFTKGEEWCKETNMRLNRSNEPAEFVRKLDVARRFIARSLGPFSWDHALPHCDFGPGASVSCPRARSHAIHKIGILKPTVTGLCVPLLNAYRSYDRHYGSLGVDFEVVAGARGTTVPKDAKTDRFISIEPLWNMFFQKGIGGLIRRRLKRRGVNLDTSWILNQELALRGSIYGDVATIDLHAASDSVSTALVERLLPDDWLYAMNLVRSPFTDVDGERILLRKFSTMGNGFTFELESLIFLALAVASWPSGTVGLDTITFGDDIVVPTAGYEPLVELLQYCGFQCNAGKSFSSGKFRESCGKHYFDGRDVTPVYLKKLDSIVDVINYRNALCGLSFRLMGMGYGRDSRFRPIVNSIDKTLPRFARATFVSPFTTGIGLWKDFDEATPRRMPHQLDGWKTVQLIQQASSRKLEDEGALVYKLWATRRGISLDGESQSRALPPSPKFRTKVVPASQWSTMGPWL